MLFVLIEDETFQQHKKHLQALEPGSGRSHPCKLQPISILTNRILLQFGLLRITQHLSWSVLTSIVGKLLKLHQCLDSLILSTGKRGAVVNFSDEISS